MDFLSVCIDLKRKFLEFDELENIITSNVDIHILGGFNLHLYLHPPPPPGNTTHFIDI